MVWDEGAGHVHIVDGVLLVSSSAQNAPSEPPRRPPSLPPASHLAGPRLSAHRLLPHGVLVEGCMPTRRDLQQGLQAARVQAGQGPSRAEHRQAS